MLRLCDIVKNYPTATTTVQALRGVSLSFRAHEFVAILGPSGCGKTTMLNIIGGLDRYTSGDLIIGGVSTASFDDLHWDAYRNATIGFVFQNYNLIPHLTVLENVEIALSLVGEKKKVRRAKAINALRKVGMEEEINKRPNQLSGGQMQRVAIARAIVNDPKIILADEPTGALDSELSVQVMEILREISETRLVIMVTHNADLAEEYASRICRFKDGQLVEDTNPYDEHIEQIAIADVETKSGEAKSDRDSANATNEPTYDEAVEIVTVDTVSQADDIEPTAEEHTLESAQDVNYEEHALSDGDVREDKKVSNRKRKKQMKKLRVDSSAIFEKLGLNSLSKQRKKKEKKNKTFKPTSMSMGMAFGLSLRNLISKKRRTFFTAFAGSIGIIGLGLVLSISNGFDVFVMNMQTEMLAGVPLGIYEYNVEVSAVMDVMSSLAKPSDNEDDYPDGDKITIKPGASGGSTEMIENVLSSFFKSVSRNELSEEFADYMRNMPEEYYSAYSEFYGVRYNLISKKLEETGETTYVDASKQPEVSSVMTIANTVLGESGVKPDYWQTLVGGEDTMMAAYTFVGENSRYPQSKEEILLCIGEKNQIDMALLDAFGISMFYEDSDGSIKPVNEENIDADFFIGKKFKLILNDDYYYYDEGADLFYYPSEVYTTAYEQQAHLKEIYEKSSAITLEIVGVIRPKKDVAAGYVSSALCYTPELAQFVVDNAYESQIAKAQRELMRLDPNDRFTVFGDIRKDDDLTAGVSLINVMRYSLKWTSFLKAIGATKTPTYINIYPATYDQKINAGNYIKQWNATNEGKVGYFDVSEMFIYNLNLIIDLVSVLLVAVASISLVVSTVMIGVITSNSVIERTREIGILRSLGARKRDIRNVFIAETSLIGLAGGLIGIVITYILCPIISAIIGAVSGVTNLLHFHPLHAFILVVLSFVLTVISGIVPAIGASRKNVVDALRVD